MRRLSLNARRSILDPVTPEVEVALFEFTHPNMPEPVRVSTDPGERISTKPLMYGTRSTWRGADPVTDPYLFVIAEALLPSDQESAPAAATVVLTDINGSVGPLLRTFTDPLNVSIAVVLALSPDVIENQWTGLRMTSSVIDAGQVSVQMNRDHIELESFPGGLLSMSRYPGLYR